MFALQTMLWGYIGVYVPPQEHSIAHLSLSTCRYGEKCVCVFPADHLTAYVSPSWEWNVCHCLHKRVSVMGLNIFVCPFRSIFFVDGQNWLIVFCEFVYQLFKTRNTLLFIIVFIVHIITTFIVHIINNHSVYWFTSCSPDQEGPICIYWFICLDVLKLDESNSPGENSIWWKR